MITLTYNGYSLQGGSIVTTETDVLTPPKRPVQVDKIAHANGGKIVQQFFDPKTFTVSGYIQANSLTAMQAQLDMFKSAMHQQNGVLLVQVDNNPARAIYCTAQQVTVANKKGSTTATFTVEFVSADGMQWDTGATSSLFTSTVVTASNTQIAATVLGSYQAQPDIKLTYTSLSATGTQTVSISNGATLKGVTVSRVWVSGDTLEINCLTQLVYINGIAVDFIGQFPIWDPGNGSLRYVDTFTARNATITAPYQQRWL